MLVIRFWTGADERRSGNGGHLYVIAKNIPFCGFFYKYLLTLLRECYIGKGGMVNIP